MQVPHDHPITAERLQVARISDVHNYCRNPSGQLPQPYCYTTDPDRAGDRCNIPDCSMYPF